jgi:hypothetical protein
MATQNSWTREGATGNNLLGMGGTEWNGTSSFYYLDYRNYDPILSTMNLKPAVYAGGLEAENQIAMGLAGAINISLGILKKDYLGALSMRNNSTQGGGPGDPPANNGPNWFFALAAEIYIWGASFTIAEHNSKPLYQGPKSWAAEAKLAGKVGNKLGALGLVLTGVDMVTNGVNTSNSLDATFGFISFAGPVGAGIGGVYFVSNLLTVGITRKTIGEHIDNNFYIMSGGPLVPMILVPKN